MSLPRFRAFLLATAIAVIALDSHAATRSRAVRPLTFLPPPAGTPWSEGGYANRTSVAPGETIEFRIATRVSPFDLRISNLAQSESVLMTLTGLTSGAQWCSEGYSTGCGWTLTTTFTIPSTWPSGYYQAKFPTSTGTEYIIFVVRAAQPGSTSPIVVIQATNTYQAYNDFGGRNVYPSNSPSRTSRVSFDRPYNDQDGLGRYLLWEKPFVDWMTRENRVFEVATDTELEDPTFLSRYKVVVIIGHSEYWTLGARRNIQAFSAGGGHIAILAGNTMWFQVRLDTAQRTITVYKDKDLDPETGRNNSIVTVNWFDAPVFNPENFITGESFRYGGYANKQPDPSFTVLPLAQRTPYTVADPDSWVFAGANLKRGDKIAKAVGGVEVDGVLYNCSADGLPSTVDGSDGTPLNFHVLATIPATAGHGVIGYYVNAAGGVVFNIGTRNWGDGLDDPVVQLITRNVLTRLVSGERFVYDGVTTPVKMRETFNCPQDTPGVFPGWRGDEGSAALTSRCGYEGPTGFEMSGANRVLLARNFTPDNVTLPNLEARFYLNADGVTGPAGAAFAIMTLQDRQNGINARWLSVQMTVASTGKTLRLQQMRADGSVEASSQSVSLPAGWNSIEVGFHAPGKLTLQVGTDTEVSLDNVHAEQRMNELVLNWGRSSGTIDGFLCVDAIAAGLQKLDPVPALR
jgi:hypothetical protein